MRLSYRTLSTTDDVENSQYKHAPKPSGFKSWKKYWCGKSGERWPPKCRYRGCGNYNADGIAHVIVNHDEDDEYIIPMCNDHKRPGFSEIYSVNSDTFAVCIDKEEIREELVGNLVDNLCVLPLEAGDRVQNVTGTGVDKSRHYKTWKRLYLAVVDRKWPSTCRISDCTEHAEGGGHIHVQGRRGVFIVPMCQKLHNTPHNMDWLSVKKGTFALRVCREDTRRLENKKRETNETKVGTVAINMHHEDPPKKSGPVKTSLFDYCVIV